MASSTAVVVHYSKCQCHECLFRVAVTKWTTLPIDIRCIKASTRSTAPNSTAHVVGTVMSHTYSLFAVTFTASGAAAYRS